MSARGTDKKKVREVAQNCTRKKKKNCSTNNFTCLSTFHHSDNMSESSSCVTLYQEILRKSSQLFFLYFIPSNKKANCFITCDKYHVDFI